ncbi:hypothetical protein [Nocardia sp. NPDC052566]|uniref:hypothetical protein n=1 Tax=Nocardia sp. NPDC052566 TaxID=3364330 RepID=UPI0037C6E5FE
MLNTEADALDHDMPRGRHRLRATGIARRWLAGSIAAAVVISPLAAAVGTANAAPTADCLWAGASHPQGATVVAGGWAFTCATDQGGARWRRGASVDAPSTVANPGAAANPAGRFSPGAIQPGTEYNDYCVGTQLVDGSEQMYQVVSDRWQAAGPISQWRFEPGAGPVPTTRSASLCPQDPVLWPQS